MIVNANLIVQHVTQIENGIMKHVYVLVKIILYAKKTRKQQWRQISGSKKNGSGLAQRNDPECFVIINLVLSDTNGGINAVCSGPLDTSLVDTNMDEFIIKNKVGEDIKYNDASSDNKKVKVNIFVKRLGKAPLTHELIKLLEVPKTKKS